MTAASSTELYWAATPLQALASNGMIDQDLPHQMSRDADRLSAVPPFNVGLIDQS